MMRLIETHAERVADARLRRQRWHSGQERMKRGLVSESRIELCGGPSGGFETTCFDCFDDHQTTTKIGEAFYSHLYARRRDERSKFDYVSSFRHFDKSEIGTPEWRDIMEAFGGPLT